MRIIIIRPKFSHPPVPPPDTPLGALYVLSALRNEGHFVSFCDSNNQELPDLEKFDVVGFTMLPFARKQAFGLIKEIKNKYPEKKVILGGTFPSSVPLQLLEEYPIDAIVMGEGEETTRELLNCWENGESIDSVKGIATKKLGVHPKRELLKMDELPRPAWDLINFDWYKMQFAQAHPSWIINGVEFGKARYTGISASRGCPGRCYFCNTPKHWQYRYRWMSGFVLGREVEYLYNHYNIQLFSFNDDCFPVNPQQLNEFCDYLKKSNIHIAWKCDTRADVLNKEMIQKMKESGCFMIALGVESGSEKIIKNIKKGINLEKTKEVIKLINEAGIVSYALLMVGNIGETEETIQETKKWMLDAQPQIYSFVCGVMITPDTELCEYCEKINYLNPDYWAKEEDGLPYFLAENSYEKLTQFSTILNTIPKRL